MKKYLQIVIALALLVSVGVAQNAPTTGPTTAVGRRGRGPAGPVLAVTADHGDWNYLPGEKVKFSIKGPAGTAIMYQVGPEMMPAEAKRAVIPESGVLEVDGGTMNQPGFLRCIAATEAAAARGRGGVAGAQGKGLATAGFSPERIKPTQTEPADFDAFWDKARAELAGLPIDPKLTPMENLTNEKAEVFEVSLQNIGTSPSTTSRFYGILYIPRREGPFPAMMSPPGAGVRGPDRDIWGWVDRGFIVLYVGIHEMPVVPVQGGAPTTQVTGNYPNSGLENPDSYYFRKVIMGCLRANDYLVTLPKWDRKNLVAYGGSQGGYLSIATAGLDPRVTAVAPAYPAYCDVTGYVHGRPAGWPAFRFNDMNDPQRAAKIATTAYFDGVNFARRIKVPGHYVWGYNDETCPPTTTFSAYNVITAPKTLTIFKEMGHARIPGVTEAEHDWVMKQLR